jgi:hemolysin activation/secretion protein
MKTKNLLFLGILSITLSSHAQTNPRGNPIDKLPQVNINQNNKPSVVIESKEQPLKNDEEFIQIKSFRIEGVKSIDFKQVSQLFEPLTNKNITVKDVVAASTKITEIYKKEGFPLSFAFVPQQDFKEGIARIVAVEGYIKTVTLKGKIDNNERINDILEPLKNEKPLRQASFDKVVGILALQPGVKVNLNVPLPNTIDGGAAMEADIVQKKYDISLGLDTNSPGVQTVVSATVNSLTPLGDQLTVPALLPTGSRDSKYYGLNYLVPLNSKGTIGKINLSTYKENVNLANLGSYGYQTEYLNKSDRIAFDVSHPLILESKRSWFIGGGLYLNNEEQSYTPINTALYPVLTNQTRVTVMQLNTTYTRASEDQATQLALSVSKGIKALGASQQNNQNDLDFFKLKAQAVQTFNLTKKVGLQFSGVYQYSPDTLPNSEQISFGGRYFGNAYEAGQIAGDKGWGASAELNYKIDTTFNYLKVVQPYVSLDTSRVSVNKGTLANPHISSATLGVRLSNQQHYNVTLAASKPLQNIPAFGNKTRYYLALAYQF